MRPPHRGLSAPGAVPGSKRTPRNRSNHGIAKGDVGLPNGIMLLRKRMTSWQRTCEGDPILVGEEGHCGKKALLDRLVG